MIGRILAALRAVHLPCKMEWPDLLGPEDRTLLATLPALDPYREARDNVESYRIQQGPVDLEQSQQDCRLYVT